MPQEASKWQKRLACVGSEQYQVRLVKPVSTVLPHSCRVDRVLLHPGRRLGLGGYNVSCACSGAVLSQRLVPAVHLQPRLHAPVDSPPTLTDSHGYRDLSGHTLKSCPPLSATITINGCSDQACPGCPKSAHGKRNTSLCSPSTRLPTSPGCILCRPSSPRRSRSCYCVSMALRLCCPLWQKSPKSQALLKERALLQPAKHPLLPDSQYLWQVTLVQQKKFGSYAARAIIPLTEAKANPQLCPSNRLCMQPAQFRQTAGVYMWKGGQSFILPMALAMVGTQRDQKLPYLPGHS